MSAPLVTYFAVKEIRVGNDVRVEGDLVPEARDWPALASFIQRGLLAPIPVAALPRGAREFLDEWHEEYEATKAANVIAAKEQEEAWATQRQTQAKTTMESVYADAENYVAPFVPVLREDVDLRDLSALPSDLGAVDLTVAAIPVKEETPFPVSEFESNVEIPTPPAEPTQPEGDEDDDDDLEDDEETEEEEPIVKAPVKRTAAARKPVAKTPAPKRTPVAKKEKVEA